jgi:hypothetical protein
LITAMIIFIRASSVVCSHFRYAVYAALSQDT